MTVIYPDENYSYSSHAQQASDPARDLEDQKKIIAEATAEIKDELLVKWRKHYAGAEIFPKKLSAVHPEVMKFMLQFKHVLFYDKVAANFRFSRAQREKLPQMVWEIVMKKAWQGNTRLLADELRLNSQNVKAVGDMLFEGVFGEAMKLWEKPVAQRSHVVSSAIENKTGVETSALSLQQALKQYPQLGEQSITSNQIKVKVFPDPVRPSIKNWINDYYENLGAGKHGSIERGNYLFHGENTKRLTPGERQKLGTVLKSLDEGTLLTIDPKKQAIVFSLGEDQSISPEKGGGNFSFSSPQRMQSERPSQPQSNFSKPNFSNQPSSQQEADPKIKGNIVDLRG